ncbi:sulfite exporter TauE/SafE family protein [Roseomonas sp. SSH11]|uniref:Sulfite exporter TauE/SafE family protein n=1 Tax=Pararoseomonas baculiformis TaxID=2820812 RepID=A0ABS4ALN7_9PROT|nr:sulfite exporter TauE/SafE family protein [Pararoseomonas baculiformis]MBP0447129.1 sulfite exporter TauE/SafE family protein [Pararoseomonas baculiformis]
MLSDCLHGLTALGTAGMAALMGAMLLAGLAGGVTHCAGMCGPLVIAQIADAPPGGRLARMAGAVLLPYHAGRLLGYGALGALAGGTAGLVSAFVSPALLALPLALAALAMLAQACARLPLPGWARLHLPAAPMPGFAMLGRLLRAPPGPGRGFLLGLLLSAMPCGLLYGALAGAMAAGSALAGALAMGAFVIGTLPALAGVALLGRFFGRRFGGGLRLASGIALAVNGAALAALALRTAGGG